LELEIFTRFGGMVDERTRATIEHGRRIRAVLTQTEFNPLSQAHQVALLIAINEKLLDRVPVEKVAEVRSALGAWLDARAANHVQQINQGGPLSDETRAALIAAMRELIEKVGAASAEKR
jgi:F0F1-type ATP synthase alpha subunit